MNFEKMLRKLQIAAVAAGLTLLMAACATPDTRNPNAESTSRRSESSTSPPLETAPEQSQEVGADGDSRPRPSPAATSSSRAAPSPAAKNASADKPTTTASPTPGSSPTSPQKSSSGCSTWEGGAPGVGFGGGPSCSYTATKPGGYVGQGGWSVTIKRGETTIEVDYSKDPSCSQTGFIHPGDEVTARVPACCGYNSISVGDESHCDGRLP